MGLDTDARHHCRRDHAAPGSDRRWLVLPVLCLSVFLVVVDNTIVNVALPTLNRQLGASITSLQWIVDAYSLAFAGLLLAGGGIGDRLGRKGTMQVGLIFFGLFSAAAALSHSTGTLIGARALMGVAAAFVFPASLAILTTVFPDHAERQKALGIWGATSGIAVAFGPVVGGALLEHFWYGSIFLVNVPIVVVTLVAGQALIPRLPKVASHRFDFRGVLISTVGVTSLVLAIIEGPQWGWASIGTLACFGLAAVMLTVFTCARAADRGAAARRAGVPDPPLHRWRLVDLRGVLQSLRVHLPHHPVLPVREGVLDAVGRRAHASLRRGGGRGHAARRGAGAQDRHPRRGHDRIAVDGGRAGRHRLQLHGHDGVLGSDRRGHGALALGLSSITAPTTEAVMGSVPDEQRGAAAGVNNTTRELGGTLGVAVFGSLFASAYAPRVMSAFKPLPIPAGPKAEAHQSVAAALAVVKQAPHSVQPYLEHIAFAAFHSGLQTACLAGAGVAVVGALTVFRLLPGRQGVPAGRHRGRGRGALRRAGAGPGVGMLTRRAAPRYGKGREASRSR